MSCVGDGAGGFQREHQAARYEFVIFALSTVFLVARHGLYRAILRRQTNLIFSLVHLLFVQFRHLTRQICGIGAKKNAEGAIYCGVRLFRSHFIRTLSVKQINASRITSPGL